ncbi:MAG: hypothetical protein GX996_08990 [Firmicutes bacterium]|nr:hypothetical protein [Bacillota bacterium]
MKRTLVIMFLVLAISTSIIAGTMAMYVVEIDDLAEGSVVAKEFVLKPGETNTFAEDVEIAPGESVDWEFSVKNYEGGVVSETAMDLDIAVDIDDAAGKDAIAPLEITIIDEVEGVRGHEIGTGSIEFNDEFALDKDGQEKTYKVLIEWPSDDEVDIDYAGADYGTAVKVSIIGTQK